MHFSISRASGSNASHRHAARAWTTTLLAAAFVLAPIAALADDGDLEKHATADEWLAEAWRLKAEGDLDGAAFAFDRARAAGADEQGVDLELGYLDRSAGHPSIARYHFEAATHGGDALVADRARAELGYLPSHFWSDFYGEVIAWHRIAGAPLADDLVPMGRLRLLFRPSLELDVHLYLYAQATRDLASRGRGPQGGPIIYADDYALAGGGILFRAAGGRVSLFAQAGPAMNLLDDGRSRFAFDGRAGIVVADETPSCRPPPGPARFAAIPCAEVYSEAVYASRYDHDVVGLLRPRVALTVLVAGPVVLQPFLEGRAAADSNGDFWNNRADAGGGLRVRLLRPFALDVLGGVHAGRYFGQRGVDPLPDPPGYAELRLQAATYVAF